MLIKKPAIIVDIDGTLANNDHRRHFVENTKHKDWPSFFAGIPDDKPNEWCVDLINAFENLGYAILLVTGRGEEHREETLAWLKKCAIYWDQLLMRAARDSRQDAIVKRELYERRITPLFDVAFCVDDRKQVVDMWRGLGLVVLDCAGNTF